MATELTPEEIRKSIVPKSDQLNADDLLTGPITVTVESVKAGDKEQPVVIGISNHQPFKPCKSMRRVLIKAWGDDGKAWVGRRMTLFCDPEVKWAGVKIGGVRISHLSDIDAELVLMLTETRGKKSEWKIRKLQDGNRVIEATVRIIQHAIKEGDSAMLKSTAANIAAGDKKAIASMLSAEELAALKAATMGGDTDGQANH